MIENLNLIKDGFYKKAIGLLFVSNTNKQITGAYVKIAFFINETDILYQDIIEGDLFQQAAKTFDLLTTKYLRASIRTDGLQRIEELPYTENTLREAIVNAIVHKDYLSGIPVQISVYSNKIIFFNPGKLPEGLTISDLKKRHPSKPHNPILANVFFRAGLIDSWGRGTLKILKECKEYGNPIPKFHSDNLGFELTIKAKIMSGKTSEKVSGKTSEKMIQMISNNPKITIEQMSNEIGVSERSIERNIKKLKDLGEIKREGSARDGYWVIQKDRNY